MPQMPPSKAVGFKPLAEEWNYYSIDDGYILGVKLVLTKVLKTSQTDQAGVPVYVIQHQPAVQVLTQRRVQEYHQQRHDIKVKSRASLKWRGMIRWPRLPVSVELA